MNLFFERALFPTKAPEYHMENQPEETPLRKTPLGNSQLGELLGYLSMFNSSGFSLSSCEGSLAPLLSPGLAPSPPPAGSCGGADVPTVGSLDVATTAGESSPRARRKSRRRRRGKRGGLLSPLPSPATFSDEETLAAILDRLGPGAFLEKALGIVGRRSGFFGEAGAAGLVWGLVSRAFRQARGGQAAAAAAEGSWEWRRTAAAAKPSGVATRGEARDSRDWARGSWLVGSAGDVGPGGSAVSLTQPVPQLFLTSPMVRALLNHGRLTVMKALVEAMILSLQRECYRGYDQDWPWLMA